LIGSVDSELGRTLLLYELPFEELSIDSVVPRSSSGSGVSYGQIRPRSAAVLEIIESDDMKVA
jgi:hypothetical protein